MNITIIGTGYVGLVNGVCMAYNGAHVTCIDIDNEKVDRLNNGECVIYEKMLDSMLQYCIQEKRINFTTDYSSVNVSTLIFVCVGTPENEDGTANLDYVYGAVRSILETVDPKHECVIVIKSTVPVGTTDNVRRIVDSKLPDGHKVHVAFNPEFLQEGVAVRNCTSPDRVVVGLEYTDRHTFEFNELVNVLYSGVMHCIDKVKVLSIRSAEMVKYASNAMLATRISFTNEIANLCEAVSADVEEVMKVVGLDHRIGPYFLRAGCGYGGSCFPKDVKALIKRGEECGKHMLVLSAVDAVNEMQKDVLFDKYTSYFSKSDKVRACVLGLAFKPGTDDMREAPSINLINSLVDYGADVIACDPIAVPNAKKIFGNKIEYTTDPYEAIKDSDVVFVVTEWGGFMDIKPEKMKELMNGSVVIDGRNIFDKRKMKSLNFIYDRIG